MLVVMEEPKQGDRCLMSLAIRTPAFSSTAAHALVRRAKPAAIAAGVVLVLGVSFVGGRAYQNGVDQPLISQYAPASPSGGLSAAKLGNVRLPSNLGGAASGGQPQVYIIQK